MIKILILSIVPLLISACQKHQNGSKNPPAIRILDVTVIDAVTGKIPVRGSISFSPPTPALVGGGVTEMPVEPSDPERYHIRITWLQPDLVDQTVTIHIEGYKPVILGMDYIVTTKSSTSIAGRFNKRIEIHPDPK